MIPQDRLQEIYKNNLERISLFNQEIGMIIGMMLISGIGLFSVFSGNYKPIAIILGVQTFGLLLCFSIIIRLKYITDPYRYYRSSEKLEKGELIMIENDLKNSFRLTFVAMVLVALFGLVEMLAGCFNNIARLYFPAQIMTIVCCMYCFWRYRNYKNK